MQVRVAHRAGDHVLHILPQCLFMALLRIVGTARNVVPLVDADPPTYSDCDSFVGFRAHPDSGLFKVICVQPESILTEPLCMDPPFFSIPIGTPYLLRLRLVCRLPRSPRFGSLQSNLCPA